jgi:phytoene desaturase
MAVKHPLRAAVVGAGLGGLSAAIRLARRGWQVDVFEQREGPGGKASSRTLDGFRFDTGPSVLTMTQVLDQLLDEAGATVEERPRPVRLETVCRYAYPDGTVIRAWGEPARLADEIAGATRDRAVSVEAYLAHCRRIYERAAFLFLWKSLHEPASYVDRRALATLLHPGSLDALRTVHAANASFFRDPRTIQLFDRYATYNGSDPFRAPATLNIIPWVEHGLGAYTVQGGIASLPRALEALACRLGVAFHYGARVEAILTGGGRVRGLSWVEAGRASRGALPHGRLDAPVVVSNADVLATYDLLDDRDAPAARRYRRLEPSTSALVFLWGMRRTFPDLGVNNIFFAEDYRSEFADLFERAICPRAPTVYVNITSKVTPGDAPPGCENWFVLVNAPAIGGQEWDREVELTRRSVLRRLGQAIGREIERDIACESVLTPPDIERLTGSRRGSLYGIASNSRTAAFVRHANRSRRHRGLYFCGGSAHPGGGMPLALLSGKIASDLVTRYQGAAG